MDDRGARYARKVTSGGFTIPGVGYNARKLRQWIRVTGGVPSRTGKDPVGHILHLKHDRPEVYAGAHKFVEPMDLLNLRLTGRCVASYDTIVGHWVTDNRDLSHVDYDAELLEINAELMVSGAALLQLSAANPIDLDCPDGAGTAFVEHVDEDASGSLSVNDEVVLAIDNCFGLTVDGTLRLTALRQSGRVFDELEGQVRVEFTFAGSGSSLVADCCKITLVAPAAATDATRSVTNARSRESVST